MKFDVIRDKLGRAKYLHDNGDSITGSVYSKAIITAMFIGLYQDFFSQFGLPIWLLCILGVLPILSFNLVLGVINDRRGILKNYNNMAWEKCSIAMGLVSDVEEIRGVLGLPKKK
jgi:hypothetical protein